MEAYRRAFEALVVAFRINLMRAGGYDAEAFDGLIAQIRKDAGLDR